MNNSDQLIQDIKKELQGIAEEDLTKAEKNILRKIKSYENGLALEGK